MGSSAGNRLLGVWDDPAVLDSRGRGDTRPCGCRALVDATLGLVASRDGEEPCPEGLRAARLASWVLGLAVDCRLE